MTFARFQEAWLQLDNMSFGLVVTLFNMYRDTTRIPQVYVVVKCCVQREFLSRLRN